MYQEEDAQVSLPIDEKIAAFYDFYDYETFWVRREYEHQADVIALQALLKKMGGKKKRIIDVGVGLGRLTPCYASRCVEAVLLDSSSVQLRKTKHHLAGRYQNLSFVHGIAQDMPFSNEYADIIVCVRVSHHIVHLERFIKESMRVLTPGGYMMLEVANKLHMKARLSALRKGTLRQLSTPHPVRVNGMSEDNTPFVNHNPRTVERTLRDAGFSVVAIRSVSNFRLSFFKKIVPRKVLLLFERITQPLLAKLWFGPSVYFLVQKRTRD